MDSRLYETKKYVPGDRVRLIYPEEVDQSSRAHVTFHAGIGSNQYKPLAPGKVVIIHRIERMGGGSSATNIYRVRDAETDKLLLYGLFDADLRPLHPSKTIRTNILPIL